MVIAVFFILGALFWTFAEYWIHLQLGHKTRSNNLFKREHLAHHARPMYFAPPWMKALSATIVVGTMAPIAYLIIGVPGVAFSVGFATTYLVYEWAHARAHTHAPLTAYGRMMRKHHFAHHFMDPAMNHGMTTRFWDRVFGTFAPVEKVRVPKRDVMQWLPQANSRVWRDYTVA